MHDLIPDPGALFEAILRRPGAGSMLHGPDHWLRVAVLGREIAEEKPGADPVVVLLFALFHDAERINDHDDPGHGRRGGELARKLHGELHLISDEQMDLLQLACDAHTDGEVSDDPTVGACFDADRLQLWRVGIRPDLELLSTSKAKELATPTPHRVIPGAKEYRSSRAWKVQQSHFAWVGVFGRYGLLLPARAAEAAEAPPVSGRTAEEARADGHRIYLRMGLPPAGAVSLKREDGGFEVGVSVFRCELKDGTWEADITTVQEMGSFVGCQLAKRPAYLVTGRWRGTGSDGEPVLGDLEVLERLPYQPQMPERWRREWEEAVREYETWMNLVNPFRTSGFGFWGSGIVDLGVDDGESFVRELERKQKEELDRELAREIREEESRRQRELQARYTKTMYSSMVRNLGMGMEFGKASEQAIREAEREVMRG